jgi:alkaline phosphatase D
MKYVFTLCYSLAFTALTAQTTSTQTLSKIAFGSCGDQTKDMKIFYKIVDEQPQLFVFLGDNIYGDTEDMALLQSKYDSLAARPAYQKLQQTAPVIATWDDHDFGVNDGGKEYPKKEESKKIFLDFFKEPTNSERRRHAGIYTSYMYGEPGKRVQIIMLDCRTFRDSLVFKKHPQIWGEYQRSDDPNKTMLGAEQWQWLEGELQKPADLRIIGSSTMFLVDFNGWEAWMNLAPENQRMLDLIKKTKANGVVFISGDIHHGEISKRNVEGQYPIYDFTSSGLTHSVWFANKNKHRVGTAYCKINYGMLNLDWNNRTILFELKNKAGKTVRSKQVSLDELKF